MESESALQEKISRNSFVESEKQLSDEEKKILEYILAHGIITKNDVVGLLEVSASTATRVIRKMVKNNLLKQNGKARNTNYTIK